MFFFTMRKFINDDQNDNYDDNDNDNQWMNLGSMSSSIEFAYS